MDRDAACSPRASETDWLARRELCINPRAGRRAANAMRRASVASPVRVWSGVLQPTAVESPECYEAEPAVPGAQIDDVRDPNPVGNAHRLYAKCSAIRTPGTRIVENARTHGRAISPTEWIAAIHAAISGPEERAWPWHRVDPPVGRLEPQGMDPADPQRA